jgi:hypothetical protein
LLTYREFGKFPGHRGSFLPNEKSPKSEAERAAPKWDRWPSTGLETFLHLYLAKTPCPVDAGSCPNRSSVPSLGDRPNAKVLPLPVLSRSILPSFTAFCSVVRAGLRWGKFVFHVANSGG